MGVYLPNPGEAHINGVIVSEEKAYEEAARQFPQGYRTLKPYLRMVDL